MLNRGAGLRELQEILATSISRRPLAYLHSTMRSWLRFTVNSTHANRRTEMSKKKSEMLPADQFLDVTVYLERC